tara:strand:- start:348 stop:1664 length:1317 start_codon:yes stop_codon:yes gene_type:complete
MNSLFDILTETICETQLLEAEEDKNNPFEKEEQSGLNHYMDKIPDEGWDYFWKSWREFPDEDFETEFGKSKESYKQEFAQQVSTAIQNAVKYYKDYYSEKNPDVIEKFKKRGIFSLPGNTLDSLHKKLDKISSNDKFHKIHYTPKGSTFFNRAKDDTNSAWGYIKPHKPMNLHINLYNFSNPTVTEWQDSIYNTIVHELGHTITYLLRRLGKKPYKKIKVDNIFDKKRSKKGNYDYLEKDYVDAGNVTYEPYVLDDMETHARLQTLRESLGVTSNLTTREWVDLWMKAVNNGDIEFAEKVAMSTNTKKKFCCEGCTEDDGTTIPKEDIPIWHDQEEQVTVEIPQKYVQVCVCEKYTDKGCDKEDLTFKSREQIWYLYQNLRYFGQDHTGVGALLAKFTSKLTKKVGKFYLTIDFSQIAKINEEWAKNEIGDDIETVSV